MYKSTCLFLLIVFLTSCKNEKVSLKEGTRTFYYQQPDLMDLNSQTTVTLTQVEDGRCPEDFNCIWGGSVTVTLQFDLRNLNKKQDIQLCSGCLGDKGPNAITEKAILDLEGATYQITFKSISPNRNSKNPPKKEDYEVSVQIEKL